MLPAKVKQGHALSPYFSSYCKQVSFLHTIKGHALGIFVFFVDDFAFQMAPTHRAGVVSSPV